TCGSGGANNAFFQADVQVLGDFVPVTNGVAHPERARALRVEQNREQLVRNNILDDFGNIGEEAIEIQSFRRDAADFKEKIKQFSPLAEADFGFARGGHQYGFTSPVASAAVCESRPDCNSRIIATPALAPMRLAPAAT